MKKLIICILGLFIAFPAFADYAVQKKDNSVVIINDSVQNLGKVLEDLGLSGMPVIKVIQSELPDTSLRDHWIFNPIPVAPRIIVDPSYINSQEYLISKFDFKLLVASLYQTLSPESLVKLTPYLSAIQWFIDFPNFAGIEPFLNGLASSGILTSTENERIHTCFMNQGIDLTKMK